MAKTKAFKITQNNQYIQEINLNAGEYTFSANIRADSASITVCKFSLLVGGVWLEYDLTDQIYIGQFQKVKKVIQLNDKATKFSLISSGSGGGRIFHVDRPMFEEGSNAGTPKPNELDIEEQAEASNVKVTIGIPYYEFRKDTDGGTVQETLTIPFHIFKGNVRVSVPSANIGVLYKPTNVMVVDVSNAFNSIYVIPLKEFTASEGRVVFSIPVDGRNYEAEFQFKVKEVKDGKDGIDGIDGENAKWLKLNSTATQIKVGKDNVATPTSLMVFSQLYNLTGTVTWTYSVDGANFSSTLPTGVTRSGNEVTIDSSTSTFKVLTIRATIAGIYDTITISRVVDGKDGERGVPGKSPVTKEYRVGQTYYNNDVAIHYVYYRAGNSWWKLKDSVESHTASTSSPNTVYFEQLSSVEVMVAETIIAENANLAEFIFKNKTLFSQQGTNSSEDSLQLGEYVQLQFAQNTSTSTAPSSGWTDTPPTSVPGGQYLWMRAKVNSDVNWKPAERISGIGSLQAQWGALKDGVFYENWQAGRNWMRLNDGRIYALTEALAIADYKANLALYGETGKIFARNIEVERFSIPFKTVTSLPEMLGAIRNGYSVYLDLPKQTILHEWNVVSLPSVPSGTTISIRTNGTPKIKIKNLWDIRSEEMRNIVLAYDIRGLITIKHVGNGVWWIIEENLTVPRDGGTGDINLFIKKGEVIATGKMQTSPTFYTNRYKNGNRRDLSIQYVSSGSNILHDFTFDAPRYYNSIGSLVYTALKNGDFSISAMPWSGGVMPSIYSVSYNSRNRTLKITLAMYQYWINNGTLEYFTTSSAFDFQIISNIEIVSSVYVGINDLTD